LLAVIGIESSAHTLGVGIVSGGKVLSNERSMYLITDQGIIPMKVAEFHAQNVNSTISAALQKARLKIEDVDAVAYTRGPGIGPCLRVGELAAATISKVHQIPIYPVNHGVAHAEIAKSEGRFKDPLTLYVSGGNSQIISVTNEGQRHYHVHGETLDIGIGNMLDSFARAAKMNPAWGSSVAKAAQSGKYIRMPYSVKGMDFTFTGLLTSAIDLLAQRNVDDVSFSIQETAFSMLCEAAERALLLTGKKEIVISGGVAQSSRLKEMISIMAESHGAKFYVASNELNADNGAMIALVGEKMHRSGAKVSKDDLGTKQKFRIDTFAITWRD
jgi:N6-L-threonylcarbamoyladenine synthase